MCSSFQPHSETDQTSAMHASAHSPGGAEAMRVGVRANYPRRLVLLIRRLGVGGAERQLIALAQHLDRREFEVTVVTYDAVPRAQSSIAVPDGIRHVDLAGRSWNTFGLVRCLRRMRPSWIYSFLPRANSRLALYSPWLAGTRLIAGVRSCCAPKQAPLLRQKMMLRAEPLYLRSVDAVIVNSRAGRDLLYRATRGAVEARVVPNGIDTERFRPLPERQAVLRRRFGIAESSPVVGIVARLDRSKNHQLFLRAAALMPPEVHFVCIGGGTEDYALQLVGLAQSLGLGRRMHFAGEMTDMHAAYCGLSVATLSSSFEGFPNALGEAMACGIPCVGTDVGDVGYLLGDTGLVVRPDDPEGLASGWKNVLSWSREGAGVRARRRILDEFGHAALAQRTAAVLESLC